MSKYQNDEDFEKKAWNIVDNGIPKTITRNGKRYYISRK